MIVPSARLLFWTATVTISASLIAAAAPGAGGAALAAVVLLGIVVLIDAAGASGRLSGVAIELPPIVRMSVGREQSFDVRIRNEGGHAAIFRVALGLPSQISASVEELAVQAPADAEWSRFEWTCAGAVRGAYPVSAAYVEGPSRWGFWAARKTTPVRCEIRVYPNLWKERHNLAALFLRRGAFGVHAQRQVGKGRDFEKLREYLPGDAYDEIDWKGSARRGKPVTRVFQIEKTQEVYAVIDASRLSARPVRSSDESSDETTVLERMMAAALVLAVAAEQQGDLFGLIAFSDRVDRFVRSKNGKAHYSACRDALYTLRSRPVTPDFDELCSFIRVRMRRRALIVFLTSLDDPVIAEGFVRGVELVRRQHVALAQTIQQDGVGPLFTDHPASIDDVYARLGGQLRWNRLRQLERTLKRRGVHLTMVENEKLSASVVSQYLSVKRRQLI
ncbi:MAG TPA: DUF58 domain-containing protein [Terriglobia bacterium]|nr:DUF58 domain-containing protein [Terriglobia bacterium]